MFLFLRNLVHSHISTLEAGVHIYSKGLNCGMGFHRHYRYHSTQRLELLNKSPLKLNLTYKILFLLIMKVKKCSPKKKLLPKGIIKSHKIHQTFIYVVIFNQKERNMIISWKILSIKIKITKTENTSNCGNRTIALSCPSSSCSFGPCHQWRLTQGISEKNVSKGSCLNDCLNSSLFKSNIIFFPNGNINLSDLQIYLNVTWLNYFS